MLEFHSSTVPKIRIYEIEEELNYWTKKNFAMMNLIENVLSLNPGLYINIVDNNHPPLAQFIHCHGECSIIEINIGYGNGSLEEFLSSYLFELCNAAHILDVKEDTCILEMYRSDDDYAFDMEEYEYESKILFNEILNHGMKYRDWPDSFLEL
ncbi:MAG: hypothetical protein HON32_04860 [Francisellaceae bacterium]|jgi:hypothetical protein|nr:hypothetical protein [Francisellaceae bacterium]MBT6539368.1 hypothetical protein [Francisellaceae bacterium]